MGTLSTLTSRLIGRGTNTTADRINSYKLCTIGNGESHASPLAKNAYNWRFSRARW